jgi:hypothetical protein
MAASAAEKGVLFSNQYGAPRPTGTLGMLVVVEVSDYRILDTGTRFSWGIMTGNAFLYSRIRLVDLETGFIMRDGAYRTSSTAWQGIFSAMTSKQVQAVCDNLMEQIRPS